MELWERQDNESAKAYQAFCDYRDMGVGRSLDALHKGYLKQSANKCITKSRATINTWSARNDWQARVIAWDNHYAQSNTDDREALRAKIIADELRDYNAMLRSWEIEFKALPLHLRGHRSTSHDEQTGIVTITEFSKLTHHDLHILIKARAEIAKQGRLALGMPDKVTATELTGKDGEGINLNIKYTDDYGDE